jgi:hypothetical protein
VRISCLEPLDADPVALVESKRAAEGADRGAGFLIAPHFGVNLARAVIDGDVDGAPADRLAALAVAVRDGAV